MQSAGSPCPPLAGPGLNRAFSNAPSRHGAPSNTAVSLQKSPFVTDDEKKQEAWKYKGYPEFTKWMASSHDFFVVRRFTQLGARATLLLQDDLTKIEEDINLMDEFSMSQPSGRGGCGSFRMDQQEGSPRDTRLREAIPKLKEYYDLLNSFSEVRGRPGAQDRQVRNVENWLSNNHNAIEIPRVELR